MTSWKAQTMPLKSSTTPNSICATRRIFIFSIIFFCILFFFVPTAEYVVNSVILCQTCNQTYPKWFEPVLQSFKGSTTHPNIGLVNMEGEVLEGLESLHAQTIHVKFDRVSPDITWRDIYPLWIDEEKKHMKPKCPDIPMPDVDKYRGLDLVVAKLPCGNGSQGQRVGIRDVYRLQISLVVAKLAVESGRKEVSVVFVSDGGCEPMLELFRCDDLVWRQGQYWVYKPDILKLKQKVSLPVGACEVAASPYYFKSGKRFQESIISPSSTHNARPIKEAYVTVLHSSEIYVCGAIALARSIIQTNTTKDLILLADNTISPRSIEGLKAVGWKIKLIERIRCQTAAKGHYNEWNCSKLRIWQLTQYTKVIFIDADFVVLRNIDHFFAYPQLSAAEDTMSIFNSGVMAVEPSKCFFNILMVKRFTLNSYNGGDQGLLNEVFTWWHRAITKKMSFLKCFMDENGSRGLPNDVYMIHFVGVKPWVCYRDYDCNWDHTDRHIFASDALHGIWWQVYDALPTSLQPYCALTNYLDANIKKWRQKARSDRGFTDNHWKIDVKDPRQFTLKV